MVSRGISIEGLLTFHGSKAYIRRPINAPVVCHSIPIGCPVFFSRPRALPKTEISRRLEGDAVKPPKAPPRRLCKRNAYKREWNGRGRCERFDRHSRNHRKCQMLKTLDSTLTKIYHTLDPNHRPARLVGFQLGCIPVNSPRFLTWNEPISPVTTVLLVKAFQDQPGGR